MQESKPVATPVETSTKLRRTEKEASVSVTVFKQIVGSLMYFSATRPDIMFGVSLISRFMDKPSEDHFVAAKRILRYLRGTTDVGILYRREKKQKLIAYCDSDYAGNLDDRKSTSGYVFMLNGGAISWSSKKQPIVALSTTEAEFVAAAYCVCQGIWINRVLEAMDQKQAECIEVFCDNSSTIKLSRNPVLHGRRKHIDVRFHFLRELSNAGRIELKYCSTQNQLADIMTKGLKSESFSKIRREIGMCTCDQDEDGKLSFKKV